MSLYHENAFKSWGHYEPNPKFFPGGIAGLKACADKAKAQGIRRGAHPVGLHPDPGSVHHAGTGLPPGQDRGESPDRGGRCHHHHPARGVARILHQPAGQRTTQTVVVGEELVRYRTVAIVNVRTFFVQLRIACPVPCAVCRVPCAVCRVPCAVCRVPCAVCRVPCAVCRVLCACVITCATDRQTDRQTDKQTKQTDKQTDRQTDRQAGRQADRQTDRVRG
jgi:hypothetical protein